MSFQSINSTHTHKIFQAKPHLWIPNICGYPVHHGLLVTRMNETGQCGEGSRCEKRNAGWQDRGRGEAGRSLRKSTWISQLSGTFQFLFHSNTKSSGRNGGDRQVTPEGQSLTAVWENIAESFLIFAPLTFIATVRRSGRPRFLLYMGIRGPFQACLITPKRPASLFGAPGLCVLLT